MTPDEARAVLDAYRDSRERMPEAVRTLRDDGTTKVEIGRRSGLSRAGVDKVLARTPAANDESGPHPEG